MSVIRLIGVCAVGLVLAVGCGGEGESAGAEGAARVPASADLFVAINTDFEGEQWRTAADLLEKFPGGDLAVQSFLDSAEEDDVDFERDIKPAIGPELDLVILEFPRGGKPDVVALTQPRDREKFDALMAKGDDPAEYEIVDDWAVIAETQEAIDRFQEAAEEDSLGGSDAFEAAMDDLPDDALAKLYVNARALSDVANTEAQLETEQLQECVGGQATAFGAAVRAEQEGVRFEAAAPTEGEEGFETYEAGLPEELPAGALVYFSFNNLADPIRDFLRCVGEQNEDVDRTVAQLELAVGVSVEEDVLPLFENEGAITVYPAAEGEPIPTVSVILEVEDEDEAQETLDRIVERASQLAEGGVSVTETEVDGVAAKQLAFPFAEAPLLYAVFDGKVVVTTNEAGITGLRGDGEKLADDEIYEQALEAADAPDETTGFFYANLEAGVDYALALIESSGDQPPPPQVPDNLEPLQSFLFYGQFEDDEAKAGGFVGVE